MGLKEEKGTATKNAQKAVLEGIQNLNDAASSAEKTRKQGVIAIEGVAELSEEIIVLLSMPDLAGFLLRAGGNSMGKITVNGILDLDFTPGTKHFVSLGGIMILRDLPYFISQCNA